MKRNATAVWLGGKDGKGNLSAQSGVLNNTAYSFNSRFENEPGTNPEELIAAAHSGCFTMYLAIKVEQAGFTAEKLETRCDITIDSGTITKSHLTLSAKINGISKDKFDELVKDSELNCPVGKLLKAEITVDAALDVATM